MSRALFQPSAFSLLMYLIRYRAGSGPIQYGYLEGENVGSISGDIFREFTRGDIVARLVDVTLFPPVEPSKVLALAVNFVDQVREAQGEAPSLPQFVLKAPSDVIGPGGAIRLPPQCRSV